MLVAMFAVNCHFFFTFNLELDDSISGTNSTQTTYSCRISARYLWFGSVWFWIDGVVRDFIPFTVLFIGNVFIVIRVLRSNHIRKMQLQVTRAGGDGNKVRGTKVIDNNYVCFWIFSGFVLIVSVVYF